MPYILDLIQRVIDLLKDGGMITEAAHIFGRGRASIYGWLSRSKLEATKVKRRQKKIRLERIRKRCKTKSRIDN